MQDLSHLTTGVLANSSMGAGNTVSVNPPFSPPGSENEAYHAVDAHSMPEPDLGPVADLTHSVPGGDALADYSWDSPDVSGDGWTAT